MLCPDVFNFKLFTTRIATIILNTNPAQVMILAYMSAS